MEPYEIFDIASKWLTDRGVKNATGGGETRGRWYFASSLKLEGLDLTSIPFKFDICQGFTIDNCKVKDLTFLPKRVSYYYRFYNLDLPASAYVPVLFTEFGQQVHSVDIQGSMSWDVKKAADILYSGRPGNPGATFGSSWKPNTMKMPRELIPEKINQLRDLDER
jgi:hypothetical protein